jgi:hypothetical protein
MLCCHSERSEESIVRCSLRFFQILHSAKLAPNFVEGNAELKMTESPSIFERTHKKK